jgi:hypothetical protein
MRAQGSGFRVQALGSRVEVADSVCAVTAMEKTPVDACSVILRTRSQEPGTSRLKTSSIPLGLPFPFPFPYPSESRPGNLAFPY